MVRRFSRRSARASALGLALVASLALMGLAAASASAVSITPTSVGFYGTGGGATSFDGERYVTCKATAISGGFNSGQTATGHLRFENCTTGTNVKCTTSGQTSGTILSNELSGELDYLYPENGSFGIGLKPVGGTLFKPGTFAEFSCLGLGKVKWIGGVIAQVLSPGLNTLTTTVDLSVSAVGTSQTNKELASDAKEVAEGKFANVYLYRLSEELEGGVTKAMGLSFAGTYNFGVPATFLP